MKKFYLSTLVVRSNHRSGKIESQVWLDLTTPVERFNHQVTSGKRMLLKTVH